MKDFLPDDREEIKKAFKACLEVEEEASELNASAREMKKSLAEKFEVPTAEINKTYTQWKFYKQKPERAKNVYMLIEQIL